MKFNNLNLKSEKNKTTGTGVIIFATIICLMAVIISASILPILIYNKLTFAIVISIITIIMNSIAVIIGIVKSIQEYKQNLH